MTPITALILGILIGWLVEWIIDWVYWRRRNRGVQESAAQCQQKLAALQADLESARKESFSLKERTGQLELNASRAQYILTEPLIPDDLEVIVGIGPVIAKKLNQVGIFTFEQLAARSPEFLRTNLGDSIQRLADEESLLEQARQFAQRKQSKGTSGQ